LWSHNAILVCFTAMYPTVLCLAVLFRAGRFAVEVVKTTNELESVVTIIVANDKQMPRRDPLRHLMEVRAWGGGGGGCRRGHTSCCAGKAVHPWCAWAVVNDPVTACSWAYLCEEYDVWSSASVLS
jgi:hypothetical protein